ncbi:MAG: DUF3810 domain-containing protein [candidate division KSB1 bacterium]|nr:DUF3810 domain-containing protein [candidate division KSB1 bacterium]MDQ7065123.1 DUF3810 domain-containing protein [candidate division KSB1 bacterium]
MKSHSLQFRLIRLGLSGLVFHLLIFWGLSTQPQFIERYYSRLVYPWITAVLSRFSGLIPFSLTEMALYAIAIGLPVSVVRHLKNKRQLGRVFGYWIVGAIWLVAWFYIAWGLNYFRQPLSDSLALPATAADTTAVIDAFVVVTDRANSLSKQWQPLTRAEIETEIEAGIRRVQALVPFYRPTGQRRPKHLLLNTLLNKTLTTGFFSPVFHEVHLNADLLDIEYPFTLTHEKFHQMGFANEAEANFLAFLTCVSSSKALIQYSAYLAAVRYLGARLRIALSDYEPYATLIDTTVRRDFRRIRERWQKHAGRFSRISRKTYDRYLKANKIREGMANYTGMVDYLVGFWLPRMKDLHRRTPKARQ